MSRFRRARVRLGTTRGTNALLTRHGAQTGLVTTRGFGDVLHIGYQNRPKLFELAIKKPAPLFAEVAEIDERIAADGSDPPAARDEQSQRGTDSPEVERHRVAGDLPAQRVCQSRTRTSSSNGSPATSAFARSASRRRVSPLMKIVPRGDTTVVDAYLNPVLRAYVERLAAALPGSDLRLMTSAGGLVRGRRFHRQGQHPLRPGRRRGRLLARRAGGRLCQGDRLRHGRHQHRRVALRRPLRTRIRNRKRPACGSSRRCWRSKRSRPAAARSAASTA